MQDEVKGMKLKQIRLLKPTPPTTGTYAMQIQIRIFLHSTWLWTIRLCTQAFCQTVYGVKSSLFPFYWYQTISFRDSELLQISQV